MRPLRRGWRSPVVWLIVGFAATSVFVRLWRLTITPLWYSDETYYIGLSAELGRGVPLSRAAHMALVFPFATNAFPHPPLFFYAQGIMIRIFGENVLAGRILSAGLGLIGAALLYGAVRPLWGVFAAAVAAGLFAFHLPSVHFLRWSLPYNLAMAFEMAAFWALARGQRGRRREAWNVVAAAFAGGAAATTFFGLAALGFVSCLAAVRLGCGGHRRKTGDRHAFPMDEVGKNVDPTDGKASQSPFFLHSPSEIQRCPLRRKPWGLLLALAVGWAPIAAFMAFGSAVRGAAFWHDFGQLLGRGSGAGNTAECIRALGLQAGLLLSRDPVYALGAIGLAWTALRHRGRRWVPLYFLFVAVPILLKRGRDPEIKYDEVQFLFLLYAGVGAATAAARGRLRGFARRRGDWAAGRLRRLDSAAWLLAFLAMAPLAGLRAYQVSTRIPSKYERFGSVLSPADAYRLADWVNARVKDDDLVIAPDRVYFLLRGRLANLYQTVAYTAGATTWHESIERWRFRYPCDLHQARFIILDQTDRALVLSPANPNMDQLAAELDSGRWRVAREIGEYVVFEKSQ